MKISLLLGLMLLSSQAYAMRFLNYQAINGATSTTTSTPIQASYLTTCSLQIYTSGTLAGIVKIQASNDPITATPSHFNDISAAATTVSGNGSALITQTPISYNWVQAVFTTTSGTGVANAQFQAQGGY